MKYLLVGLMFIAAAASADYLTKDNGAVCSIPEGFNTAPYNADFNLKGMAEGCTFPHEKAVADFLKAWARVVETGLEYPICTDGQLVLGPTIPVRPCYKLITD